MAETAKFHVVHLPLHRRKLGQKRIALFRDLQLDAPAVSRIDGFMDQAALKQLVGDGGDERAAEMEMLGYAVDVDVALFGIKVPDRNQGGVFDADEADAAPRGRCGWLRGVRGNRTGYAPACENADPSR